MFVVLSFPKVYAHAVAKYWAYLRNVLPPQLVSHAGEQKKNWLMFQLNLNSYYLFIYFYFQTLPWDFVFLFENLNSCLCVSHTNFPSLKIKQRRCVTVNWVWYRSIFRYVCTATIESKVSDHAQRTTHQIYLFKLIFGQMGLFLLDSPYAPTISSSNSSSSLGLVVPKARSQGPSGQRCHFEHALSTWLQTIGILPQNSPQPMAISSSPAIKWIEVPALSHS